MWLRHSNIIWSIHFEKRLNTDSILLSLQLKQIWSLVIQGMKWQKLCHCVSYTSDMSLNSYEFLTSNSSKIRLESIRYYSNKNILNAIQMSIVIVKCQIRIVFLWKKNVAHFVWGIARLFYLLKLKVVSDILLKVVSGRKRTQHEWVMDMGAHLFLVTYKIFLY